MKRSAHFTVAAVWQETRLKRVQHFPSYLRLFLCHKAQILLGKEMGNFVTDTFLKIKTPLRNVFEGEKG